MNATTNNCDCHTRENDVCPRCLDSVKDDYNQQMINGTVGRNAIDFDIAMKEHLMKIIKNPEFIEKTQLEISALRVLRERQQTD